MSNKSFAACAVSPGHCMYSSDDNCVQRETHEAKLLLVLIVSWESHSCETW